jgi:hypothetical protein
VVRASTWDSALDEDAREREQDSRITTWGRGGRNNYCFNTLDSTHDLKCSELACWALPSACGGATFPEGRPLDDAETPGAVASRPCQEIPADLGIPSNFIGRTSLVARRGGSRPPFFFTRGTHHPPKTVSSEVRDGNRHRPPRTDSEQQDLSKIHAPRRSFFEKV